MPGEKTAIITVYLGGKHTIKEIAEHWGITEDEAVEIIEYA